MLCFASFIFVLCVHSALEAESITLGQAIFCLIYGFIMFYHTSKPYWSTEDNEERRDNNAK